MFFSTVFAGTACQLGVFLGASEQELLQLTQFSTFFHSKFEMPSNMKVVSLEKTGQLLYWEILESVGEIWRTRQKFRRTFKDIRV
jgi:hypothetical protein